MSITPPNANLKTVLASFHNSRNGAVLPIFALSVFAVFFAAGVGVDFARLSSVRTALQSGLDAAVLSSASVAREDVSANDIAETYFGANWQERHTSGEVDVSLSLVDDVISATAEVPVPMTLMKLAGIDEVTVSAMSKVSIAGYDVEMALVLDTTASMTGQKLEDLKQAATKLIDTLYLTSIEADRVKVALVPFAQYVNVGLANRYESWIDVPADSSATEERCSTVSPVTATTNCRMETRTSNNDGRTNTFEYEVCDNEYGPPETQCNMVTTSSVWHGCVGSRDTPLNARDEQYSTRIPGLMNTQCSDELTPLTNNKTELLNKIQAMTAKQETYIPAGLVWGWRVLSSIEPFSQGAPAADVTSGEVRKIMVLMTDGENTKSKTLFSPKHDGDLKLASDVVSLDLCERVKDENIEMFTVAFDVTSTTVLDAMRTCATDITNFFQADTSEELERAFVTIGRSTRSVSLME